MKLSIVIVSYNTIDLLHDCLESIKRHILQDVEVYVVDNNSCDGSSRMVESEYCWVKLIKNDHNLGFAAANNQAIQLSNSSYIMLLNPDTVMLPETLPGIIAFMDQYPEAGVVGCKLLNPDGSLQPSVTSFPHSLKDAIGIGLKGFCLKNDPVSRKWISRFVRLFGFNASRFTDHSEIMEIGYPRGACMTIRKNALDQVGLLDPDYFFTGEEMDLCYRIRQAGWKVLYYPEVAVIHHDHGSSRHMMGKVFVQTRKSALYFYEKHYSSFHTFLMKIMVSAVLLLHCIFLTLWLIPSGHNKEILARREVYWFVIRLHFDSGFRSQNVFSEMIFRYQ